MDDVAQRRLSAVLGDRPTLSRHYLRQRGLETGALDQGTAVLAEHGIAPRPCQSRSASLTTSYAGHVSYMILVACFSLFMYPFTYLAGPDLGYSVNYAFVLFPAFRILLNKGGREPHAAVLLAVLLYVLVFALSIVLQVNSGNAALRQVGSFALFMSMFAFTPISIDERTISAFKNAVVIISLYLSLEAMLGFYRAGGASLDFEAKDIVGTQRIGFLHIMAFWICWSLTFRNRMLGYSKYLLISVVLTGIALTFSRASVVAFAATLIAFVMTARAKGPAFRTWLTNLWVLVLGLSAGLLVVQTFFPIVLDFFDARLVDYGLDINRVADSIAGADTSEGTRFYVWRNILQFVALHPLTGSGYMGVWTLDLFGGLTGSAHNQYMDVLFRVGAFGFAAYAALLYWIAKRVRTIGPDLFLGYIGVLAYGLFHETFKESQGGFVLAFLLGAACNKSSLVENQSVSNRPEGTRAPVAERVPNTSCASTTQRISRAPQNPLRC